MLRPWHFSGRNKKQRLLYGGKDLWRYLLQFTARIRANFIVRPGCALSLGHSGSENASHPPCFLALPLLSLLIPAWCCRVPLGTHTSRRQTDKSDSACGGSRETSAMESTELFSRCTRTSEMREQKCSFKI